MRGAAVFLQGGLRRVLSVAQRMRSQESPAADSTLQLLFCRCVGGGVSHRTGVHGAHGVSERGHGGGLLSLPQPINVAFPVSIEVIHSTDFLPVFVGRFAGLVFFGAQETDVVIDIGLADTEPGFEARLALLEQLGADDAALSRAVDPERQNGDRVGQEPCQAARRA